MLKKLFGEQPGRQPASLSHLGCDMHSHLIPGIDDGSPDLETSVELVKGLVELEYSAIVTTPHVMSDFYRNSSDTIRRGADDVREALHREGISIPFVAAAEYYLDDWFESLLDQKDILTFGNNHVLFELGFVAPPESLKRAIFNMQLAGYRPILAHPERYPYWHATFEKYEELHEQGVQLQVNLNSLTGVYSPHIKKVAERMLDAGIVSYIGTDCHNEGHLKIARRARYNRALERWMEQGNIGNQKLLQLLSA